MINKFCFWDLCIFRSEPIWIFPYLFNLQKSLLNLLLLWHTEEESRRLQLLVELLLLHIEGVPWRLILLFRLLDSGVKFWIIMWV